MADPRIVDPNKFVLLGAVTDWLTVYRRHAQSARPPKEIAAERKLELTRIVQLRWLTAPDLGYPTEPFRVWRRPAMPVQSEKPVTYSTTHWFTLRMAVLERPMVFVRARFNAPSAGSVIAFAGMPYASPVVGLRPFTPGFNEVQLSGAAVQSLIYTPSAELQSVTGLDHLVADDPSWQLMEIVGLPVGPDWAGVLDLDQPQGLTTAPGDARTAALDRFRRGAPFYGWEPAIPGGGNAPPWKLADPHAMLKVMEKHALPPLRDMVTTRAPNQHAAYEVQHTLPPVDPMNPANPGEPATARFFPFCTLVFGASTDPLASLISGYGTAFEDLDIPPIVLGDRALFNDPGRSDWDYMVTARYRKGADGASEAREYAAIVFAPAVGTRPPVPANLAVEREGLRAPAATDADWRAIHRVTWDKVADSLPFRVGSYAFARLPLAPAGTIVPLMGPRPYDDAPQPISATTSPAQELTGRLGALDETYPVAGAPSPNALLYALAHQDLFGLWSAWTSHSASVAEPPVQTVSLISARLETTAVAAGNCPGTLVLELSWDWASRSPRRIEIVGRLYGQAKLGDPPGNLTPPAGLQTSLGGGPGTVLQLVFSGAPAVAVVAAAGLAAQVQYLSLDGKTLLNAPVTSASPRRYRVTLSGLALDFDAAGRLGLALWARGVEERAPNRIGDWNAQPLVASTADPRPPVIVMEHEDVLMASIADARGEHHARIAWPATPGATGYFVYTTTEIKLRADRGLTDPPKSLTLSQRLAQLRDAFAADPDRRSFTRLNAQPVTGTAMQVTLPRGSKEIHLYIVLGVSAGQVESAWPAPGSPGLRKKFVAYAAPQIVRPAPPDIEVTRTLDPGVDPPVYRAGLRIRTKPGAPVTRLDIHRVRVPEAALELDTMGPPIARLVGSAAPFTVTPTLSDEPGAAQTLGTITGLDAVEGSWRRVFYRAVAWSADDPTRGLYGGRGPASAVREVIVPPAGPPHLAALTWQWPGGGAGDAQIDTTTVAPLAATPLGDHRLRADVLVEHADGSAEALFRYPANPGDDDRMQALPTNPPGAGAHGLWRTASGGATALHLLVRRASVDDQLKVRLLLTDPLGRATERVLTVPAGSPLPEPDILAPQVTRKPLVGFLVQFETTVPVTDTPAGAYKLRVRYRPGLPPGHMLEIDLPDIALAHPLENIFKGNRPIVVRRAPGSLGRTRIIIGLRGAGGQLNLAVEAPDGRTAKRRLNLV